MSRIREILLLTWIILRSQGSSLALTDGDLRLAGIGSNQFSGRLEIFHNNEWGTVCGGLPGEGLLSNFDLRAAKVACGQLGLGHAVDFFSAVNLPGQRYRYGVGEGSIFLAEVSCHRGQNHILQCTFGAIGTELASRCDHSMDVSLQCSNITSTYNGEIRLTPPDDATPTSSHPSSPSSGKLELYSNGQWKGVCLEGVTISTADTLCRQLGYTNVDRIETIPDSQTSNVWDLTLPSTCGTTSSRCISSCLGNFLPKTAGLPCQTALLHCRFVSSDDDHELFDEAPTTRSVCTVPPQPTPQMEVRLEANVNPSFRHRVDVFVGGAWGTLCSTRFSLREAFVVCNQAGFSTAVAHSDVSMVANSDASGGTGEVYFLSCTGVERHISQCDLTLTGSTQCNTHDHDVTVQCSDIITPFGSVALLGSKDRVIGASGTLVLFTDEHFHPVCDANFGDPEAGVVCRQLGYFDGVAIPNSFFGISEGRGISLSMLRLTGSCSGSESHIFSCNDGAEIYAAAAGPDCREGFDEVAVECFFEDDDEYDDEVDFRLAGEEGAQLGRLQIKYNGSWGRVCGEEFGRNEALVVCKYLGFESLLKIERRLALTLPVYLSDVSCSGLEQNPLHCNSSLSGASLCPQDDQDIWMECGLSPLPSDGNLQLVGGVTTSTSHSGRLEISQNNQWLSVCGSLFSADAAKVACRQLGFGVMVDYCTDACFGEGTDVYYARDWCSGDEASLLECPMERYHPRHCNRSTVVGLYCDERITFPTSPTTLSSSTPKPAGNSMLIYYIIAGVAGGVLLLVIIVATIFCVCCCHRRWRQKRRGTWTSAYNQRNRSNQNGHSYHNGTVGDMNTLAKEKEGGFDDPKDALEVNGSPSTSPYPDTLSNPHHDIILHALNHGHEDRDQYIAPKTKVKAQKPRSNGYHVHHIRNGLVVSRAVPNGVGHSDSDSLSPTSSDLPPPDYNELFRSESATPIRQANGFHSNGHANGCHGNKRDLSEGIGSDGEDIEKGRV